MTDAATAANVDTDAAAARRAVANRVEQITSKIIKFSYQTNMERPLINYPIGDSRNGIEYVRYFDTLESAERSARHQCRIHRREVTIGRVTEYQSAKRMKKRWTGPTEWIAKCSLDAFDRVWTDVTVLEPLFSTNPKPVMRDLFA